jgi:hypothetical protein
MIEATETGEILALADVPYRIGIDPRSYRNPSASSTSAIATVIKGIPIAFGIRNETYTIDRVPR